MRCLISLLSFCVCLFPVGNSQAFQDAIIAKMILGRPLIEDQLESIYQFTDAIVDGAEGITIREFKVGKPSVKLSVLIVEPRKYGFKIRDKITWDKGKFGYSLNINSTEIAPPIAAKIEATEADENGNKEVTLSADEINILLKYQAELGDKIKSTDDPKTVILLPGYGVSKKALFPLALKLADHGIRSVVPDLRGQGDSNGKGLTWGKSEPQDLKELLDELIKDKTISSNSVGVVGISYGAAMASLWAENDDRVKSIVLIAPYKQADDAIVKMAEKNKDQVKLPFAVKVEQIEKGTALAAVKLKTTWANLSPAKAIPKISIPILFCTSKKDDIIRWEDVKELSQTASQGSKLHFFQDIPHEILGGNITEIETVVVDWFKESKFLP